MAFDWLNRYSPQALGALRIVTGLLFGEHGTQKLLNFPANPMMAGGGGGGGPPPGSDGGGGMGAMGFMGSSIKMKLPPLPVRVPPTEVA